MKVKHVLDHSLGHFYYLTSDNAVQKVNSVDL